MARGRHSTSTSRVAKSTKPPSVLTPMGSPRRTTGTVTRMGLSMEIRTRSAWRISSVVGSTWRSLIMASVSAAPSASLKIVFSRVSSFMIWMMSVFFRTSGTLPPPSP